MSEPSTPARVAVSFSRFVRPETVYPTLLLLWGTVFALLMPPAMTPDENGHAYRSFHLSRGRFQPDGIQAGWCYGRCPQLLESLNMQQALKVADPKSRERADDYRRYTAEPLEGLPEIKTSFAILSYSCAVPYMPQAAGIFVARKLGGSLLTAFYAGRLGNLLVCVLALAVTLHLLPCYKNLVGALSLLPIAVQQVSTLSADALGIAVGLLFTALMLRLLASGGKRPGLALLLPLWAAAAVLPLCKLPSALLTLLYLGTGPSRLGSWGRYLLVGAVLFAATGVGALVTLQASRGATAMGEGQPAPTISQSAQRAWMWQHPGKFAKTLGHTLSVDGFLYWDGLSLLGWVHLPVHPAPARSYLLWLFLLAVVDRPGGWLPGLRFRLTAFAVSLLGLVVLQTMLFLVWTPVANPIIYGFQARYFLIYLPSFFLLLLTPALSVRFGAGGLLALTAVAATAVQLATVFAILARHYLPPIFEERFTPVLLAVGPVLFFGTLLAVEARGRRGKAVEVERQAADPEGDGPVEVRELPLAG